MKNCALIVILLVGICFANAIDLQREFNLNLPGVSGGPSFNVSFEGNSGDRNALQDSIKQSMDNLKNAINQFAGNLLLQSTSRLRQALNISDDTFKSYLSNIPGLSGLFNASSGFSLPSSLSDLTKGLPQIPGLSQDGSSPFSLPKLPSLPGMPTLPGLPQLNSNPSSLFNSLPKMSLPGLPQISNPFDNMPKFGLPSLPGLPQSNSDLSSTLKNLPKMPSLPQMPNLFDPNLLSKLPSIPGLPDLNSLMSGLNSDEMKQLLGVPDVSNLGNSLSNGTVESALDNLQSKVNDAAKRANDTANSALSGLQSVGNTLSNEINKVSKSAEAQVNSTMKGLSSDIRDCVNQNGNPGSAALKTAQKSAQKCVQDKIDEAKSIINGTRNDIQQAKLGVDYLRGNLSNCHLNVSMNLASLPTFNASQPACLASALLSVQSETLLIPLSLASHGAQAVGLVQGLQGYAMKCMANLMEEIAKATLSTSLSVAKCYADKQSQ
uniref:CSON001242 protein n=1 Tax=Culicoides sonorensis TaxID=179676 RepID=A0A336LRG2_CULSO